MKLGEILRLVWINLIQNKFKVILTSIGIVAGAATIVMVIAIGRGGQLEVAEQFKNLNAGAIDISYENSHLNNGMPSGGFGGQGGNHMMGNGGFKAGDGSQSGESSSGKSSSDKKQSAGSQSEKNTQNSSSDNHSVTKEMSGDMTPPDMNGKDFSEMKEKNSQSRSSQSQDITLSEDDVEELESCLKGISDITISFSSKTDVEGGELEEATSYTIGAVKPNYQMISNLTMEMGNFLTESEEKNKEKVCVLGYSVAKEVFGSAMEAYDSTIYIDGRAYVVNGVLSEMGTVSSGISPDEAIFIPYSTGLKYVAGTEVSPTITVIAEDVNNIDTVITNIKSVLSDTYGEAEFTITDAGSKMEAASKSNDTLTTLLVAMAAIVFVIGGIGIMNVLFVSVKERTREIGILKAVGCSKGNILTEFLLEACVISIIGGILGVIFSFAITPVIEYFNVRVELSVTGAVLALGFAVVTGTLFGFYPAFKASRLVPVEALNEE